MNMDRKLTDAEYDELELFLDTDEGPYNCMTISMMDGFLTALVIGPEIIEPSKLLPVVFGTEDDEDDEEMAEFPSEKIKRITEIILHRYNYISKTFEIDPENFEPIFCYRTSDETKEPVTEEWCDGFSIGILFSKESWDPLINDEEAFNLLFPVMVFGNDVDMDDSVIHPNAFEKIPMLTYSIYGIHEYWKSHRNADAPLTILKVVQKTDRNAPCPCGSGKKYKKCCLEKTH